MERSFGVWAGVVVLAVIVLFTMTAESMTDYRNGVFIALAISIPGITIGGLCFLGFTRLWKPGWYVCVMSSLISAVSSALAVIHLAGWLAFKVLRQETLTPNESIGVMGSDLRVMYGLLGAFIGLIFGAGVGQLGISRRKDFDLPFTKPPSVW